MELVLFLALKAQGKWHKIQEMRFKNKLTFFLLFSCCVSAAGENDRFSQAAFDLAAAHFNKDGKKLILCDGPEHTFMKKAVETVFKEKGLSPYARELTFMKFSTTSQFFMDDEEKSFKQILNSLIAGCPFSKDKDNTRIYALKSSGSKHCSHPAIARLEKLGFSKLSVRFSKDSGSWFADLMHSKCADLRFYQSALDAIPEIKILFKYSIYGPNSIQIDGGFTNVIDSNGQSAFSDPVKLRYQKGSLDCISGCIHNEYTIVTLLLKKISSGNPYEFEIKKVEHQKN